MSQLLRASLLALVVLAAACGGKAKSSTPAEPDPDQHGLGSEGCGEDAPSTPEQCECHGYQVVGDIGDGQVACPDGTREVARLEYGIEGGLCCAPEAPAAP